MQGIGNIRQKTPPPLLIAGLRVFYKIKGVRLIGSFQIIKGVWLINGCQKYHSEVATTYKNEHVLC